MRGGKFLLGLAGLVGVCALLSGCATMTYTDHPHGAVSSISPVIQTNDVPTPNQETTVELGESIIGKAILVSQPAILLQEPIAHAGTNLGYAFTLTIPAGKLVAEGQDYRGVFYASPKDVGFSTSLGVTWVHAGVVISDDGKTMSVYWKASDADEFISDVTHSTPYKPAVDENWQKGSFQQELVYNGRSGNAVKFIYRELKDDLMRPAFTQEVSYDLSIGEIIGFKGARFKILEATNTQLKYVMLKSFD